MEAQLVHKRENLLFGILLGLSIITTLILLISLIGIYIIVVFGTMAVMANGIANAYIRMNGVQITERQFPELYQKVEELAKKMGLVYRPEVYILESGGMLNAFATKASGLFGKHMIVLFSDLVEMHGEDQFDIDFIIAHELAHIKRSHILKSVLILPAQWIPIVGSTYSRYCEYTCDRMAAYYTGNPENAINSLLVLAAGPKLYKNTNVQEYLHQYNDKKGFFAALAELTSTHPSLPKRIHAIEESMYGSSFVELTNRRGYTIAISTITFVGFAIFAGLFLVGVYFAVQEELATGNFGFGDDNINEDYYAGDDAFRSLTEEDALLMSAIQDGQAAEITRLVNSGADPNAINGYGETALTFAIYTDQTDLVQVLLENGADPNQFDHHDYTPLMAAVEFGNLEACQVLLQFGADPNLEDLGGYTAIDMAEFYEFWEFLDLVNNSNI